MKKVIVTLLALACAGCSACQLPAQDTQKNTALENDVPTNPLSITEQDHYKILKDDPTQPDADKYVFGDPVEDCRLGLRAEQDKITGGQSIWIIIRIKNESDKTIYTGYTGPDRDNDFSAFDQNKKPLTPLQFKKHLDETKNICMNISVQIPAGHSLYFRVNLARQFDFSAAGDYTITCKRTNLGLLKNGKVGSFTLQSAALKLKVNR